MDPWKFKNDDHYETPDKAWRLLTQYIPKNFSIWEPFYGSGNSSEVLTKFGFKHYHVKEDFFGINSTENDIIISNPPYSIKKKVLEKIVTFDKPWALLLPIATICNQYFLNLMKNTYYQIIIPTKRINYLKKGEKIHGAGFDTIWICVGLQLFLPKRQIIYEPLVDMIDVKIENEKSHEKINKH